MALVSIYERGKILDVDPSLKKYRLLKARPGILASFSNRAGAVLLGIFLLLFGILCGYVLFAERLTTFQLIILVMGLCCAPLGLWMLEKARKDFGTDARLHSFFSWDDARVVKGTTKPIGQAEIKAILRTSKTERTAKLVALASNIAEIPVSTIDSVELHAALPNLNIDKLKISGGGTAMMVDFDNLLPSLNFSGINGNMAFNSISLYYTKATGNTIKASIGKVSADKTTKV